MICPLPLAAAGANAALWTFVLYTVGMLVIAASAGRLLKTKSFVNEYFLGSRGLGMWAFALTFAATSASGGTFMGFPAKIYSHGWIMALWIASYMVYPLCTMGILGKRINQVARKTGAITIPDVLRDRFESTGFGLLATSLILFFMAFNLVAQFKAGAMILEPIAADIPQFQALSTRVGSAISGVSFLSGVDPGYLTALGLFSLVLLVYTTYGGFHAEAWTDVMQGFVMVAGVLIMLPLALWQVGGLEAGTRKLAEERPVYQYAELTVLLPHDSPSLNLYSYDEIRVDLSNAAEVGDELPYDWVVFTHATVIPAGVESKVVVRVGRPVLEVYETPPPITSRELPVVNVRLLGTSYVTGPGPEYSDPDGFLPLGMAISFFFMWAISGTGQPQYMVRLMSFKDSKTLRRAIITVTIYYGLIYFPLVVIFCCARVLVPGMEHEADKIMPTMAGVLTENAGVPWLKGILLAAPFAAVMSTVDSYLLMVASCAVRDMYQRTINPDASERTIRILSRLTVVSVGGLALCIAINPPTYLQDIIVYVGSGLACCFLFPVLAAVYVPRSNVQGCAAAMAVGFVAHLAPHVVSKLAGGSFADPPPVLGMSPLLLGLAASLAAMLVVTPLTRPADEHLVRRYFYKSEPT
jgi:sodium/pantothenate symporter